MSSMLYIQQKENNQKEATMIKTFKEKHNLRVKPEILGIAAQLALVTYLLTDQFNIAVPIFIQGILLGFSISGNIAWLLKVRKERNNNHE